MRADRLMSILLHLQAQGRTTVRELAERLEVSERTIRRDMDALCASGIPLYALRGVQGGWVLPEGYRSKLTGLTSGEIRALVLLQESSVVRDLTLDGETGSAMAKLLSALPSDKRGEAEFVRRHLHIDGAGWHGAGEPAPWLQTVQQAVWEGRRLRFRYASTYAEGRETEKTVSPWGLVAKRQTWYFVALAGEENGEGGGELRTYRVSRVLEAKLTEERFEAPPDFDLAAWWEQSTRRFKEALPKYPATVRLREEALERLERERFASVGATVRGEDGWIEAEVDFQTLETARDLLLVLGGSAAAISPEELRQAVRRAAEDVLTAYGDGLAIAESREE